VFERVKRHGENSPLGLFLKAEAARMTDCLATIINSLQVSSEVNVPPCWSTLCKLVLLNIYILQQDLQSMLSSSAKGDVVSPHLVYTALSLLALSVPQYWKSVVGSTAPPVSWPLREWVQDLISRYAFMDRFLLGGIVKTPTYWLGAFFSPQTLLSIIQQVIKHSYVVHVFMYL